MRHFLSLVARFRSDERGAFLAIFGVIAVVLVAMSGAVVDYTSVEQARTRAQVALDAAALALQPQIYTKTPEQLRLLAEGVMLERLGTTAGWALCPVAKDGVPPCGKVTSATVDKINGVLNLKASIDVPLHFVALIGIDHMKANLVSQATRGSSNVEVAVALDTTGSMKGQKILDLQAATIELIDIVVQDEQTPTYSKIALVPYSMGVNVDTYAASVRTVVGAKAITGASWASGAAKLITGASKTNPVEITSAAHGFANGDRVYITGVGGMTQINNKIFTVTSAATNKFSLLGVNGTTYNNYSNNTGTVTRCQTSACEVVITAATHGLANAEQVYITGVGGMTQINDKIFTVASGTLNTFVLSGVVGTSYNAYTSGGSAYCIKYGCEYYYFQSPSSNWNMFKVSTCVTDRTINPYTDVAPSTTGMGLNYPASSNPCISNPIIPLSSDKAEKGVLKTAVGKLAAGGSTSGHIGVAWAWYMLSPNFGYLWPSASQPANYKTPNLIKAVIIMTDGEFNSPYCKGVISKDATNGSGNTSDHNNCNSPNGSSYAQSLAQCQAMKAADIVVYTVGFDIVDSQSARDLMAQCATDPSHAYIANTGTALKQAFKDIGANITSLRMSQ